MQTPRRLSRAFAAALAHGAVTPFDVEKAAMKAGGKSAGWMARAKALLAVPQDVMVSMTQFTGDPAAVLRWRDAMADLIEE